MLFECFCETTYFLAGCFELIAFIRENKGSKIITGTSPVRKSHLFHSDSLRKKCDVYQVLRWLV